MLGIVTIRSPWVQENANIESDSGTSNNIITEVGLAYVISSQESLGLNKNLQGNEFNLNLNVLLTENVSNGKTSKAYVILFK